MILQLFCFFATISTCYGSLIPKEFPAEILDQFLTAALLSDSAPLQLDLSNPVNPLEDNPHSIFEWKDIGTIHEIFHVVRVYSWEKSCWAKMTGLIVLKRDGDLLKIIDIIASGDRHANRILEEGCDVAGDIVHFSKGESTASLIDIAFELNPDDAELNSAFENSSKMNITYGEISSGVVTEHVAKISPEGKVLSRDLIPNKNLKAAALEILRT